MSAPRTMAATLMQWTVNLVLAVITVASVAYLVPSLLGYERYVITGGSMSGAFEKGSVAFERPTPVEDLRVGDVITYLPPTDSGLSTLVTHRIVDTDRDKTGRRLFTTQGDANPDPDPWTFTLDQGTQPTVVFTVPLVGHALIALADRETRMVVVGIPAGLIALLALFELAGALRKKDTDAEPVEAGAPMTLAA